MDDPTLRRMKKKSKVSSSEDSRMVGKHTYRKKLPQKKLGSSQHIAAPVIKSVDKQKKRNSGDMDKSSKAAVSPDKSAKMKLIKGKKDKQASEKSLSVGPKRSLQSKKSSINNARNIKLLKHSQAFQGMSYSCFVVVTLFFWRHF